MRLKMTLLKLWSSLRHVATHAGITLLAVGLAFSLPQAASYILFNWWPKMRDDAQVLMFTEIGFATALVLLFNLLKLTWDYRNKARMTTIASLVYAREGHDRAALRAKGNHLRNPLWKRDLTIMAVTGYGTFVADDSPFQEIFQDCYEIRVLLMNPYGSGAAAYAAAHVDPETTLAELRREVQSSISCLRELQGPGKNIAVKFYDDTPFWKLVFTGEHVWVRSCHTTRDAGKYPEYVFALQPESPNRGFFPAFYSYFLDQWNDPRNPNYDFATNELIYSAGDAKARRLPYPGEKDKEEPAEAGREPLPA